MSDWSELERFLETDPVDVGCDEAMRILHVYVELVASGDDAAARYPGVAEHLRHCGPCGDDFQGLLELVDDPPRDSRRKKWGRQR